MNLGKMFSFEGRVGRAEYWGLSIGLSIISAIGGFMAGSENTVLIILGVLIILAVIVPALATSVKRWHDRDKVGWWIFITLIPLIGGIWALVEQGFLSGMDGDNRFGSPGGGSAFNG